MTAAPPQAEDTQERETLATVLEAVRRRWLLIAGIVVACVLIALVRQATATDSYEATAGLTFGNASLTDSALQVSRGSGDPERDAATNVLVASSREVAEGVRSELETTASPETLSSAISVEAAPNANVIYITASTDSATYSARLANAFAEQYIAFEQRSQLEAIEAAEADLRDRIEALPEGSAEQATLETSLQRLGELGAAAGSGVEIISAASPPGAPTGSGLMTTAMLGLLIGLAIAATLTFLLESLDRRINSVQAFSRAYGLPVLATVPQSAFRPRPDRQRGVELEPYRILRSALDYVAIARPVDTLVVTSAVAEEGKTAVSTNLARVVALGGRKVVVVELDLRRPTFARQFSLDPNRGVTTALTGRADVAGLLARPVSELPSLAVLPSGPLPPNPSELLASDAVTDLLAELAADDTLVIIDAPPLNPVADTRALLNNPAIGAVLIVARIGHTTRDQVQRAREFLERHVPQPVGLTVTGLRDAARAGYGSYEAVEDPAPSMPEATRQPSGRSVRRVPR